MMDNRKLFPVLTLLTLLLVVSTVSAVDDDTGVTASTDTTQQLHGATSGQVMDTGNMESVDKSIETRNLKGATTRNVTVTPENYGEYVFEGSLIGAKKNTKISFQGEFPNKNQIYIDTSDVVLDGTQATFTNTAFILDAQNIVLQNMNIINNETRYTISNRQDNNIIAGNTITVKNRNTKTSTIYNTASHTLIADNTLVVEAPTGDIDFSSGQGVADTQAILLLGGDNNTVQNNTINIKATSTSFYGTLEAITNSNNATNTIITQNRINISKSNFNYAVDSLNNVENITITDNVINVDGERYCDAIQVGNNARNILIDGNNMTCTCINTTPLTSEGALSYGVIGTSMGGDLTTNMTITNNNIELTATVSYAIELYWVNTTEIHNNTINVHGPYSLAIGYAYSPHGNATNNTITINGNSSVETNYITEEIKQENTGIRIQNGTQNISLEHNTIITNDLGGRDSTIHTDESNVTIRNNKLVSSKAIGDDTIIAPSDAVIEGNIIETTTTTEDVTTLINTQTTLKATVTTTDGYNITGGTVTFTDEADNILAQATLNNSTATTTVTFTEAIQSTITATYNPANTGLTTSSSQATITVRDSLTTTTTLQPLTLNTDNTTTLTATITTEVDVNTGQVYFKADGKILRDATTGKILYANVTDNTATLDYQVPKAWNKDTQLQAVYTGNGLLNTSTSQTIKPTITLQPEEETTFTVADTTATAGSEVTITVTTKNLDNGKVVLKINGKTVKATDGKLYTKTTSDTTTFTYTVPKTLKTGEYAIKAVYTSGTAKLGADARLTVQ